MTNFSLQYQEWEIGFISWFNDERGFGVIDSPDDQEYFLHSTNWIDTNVLSNSNKKKPVIFQKFKRNHRLEARQCAFLSLKNLEHVKIVTEKLVIQNNSPNLFQWDLISNLLSDDNLPVLKIICSEIINILTVTELHNRKNLIYHLHNRTLNNEFKSYLREKIFIKVCTWDNMDVLSFWRANILPSFRPTDTILLNLINELTNDEIKKLQDPEVNDSLLSNRLENLSENYNSDDFIAFEAFIPLIKDVGIRENITKQLNRIGLKYFIPELFSEIDDFTKNPDLQPEDITNYLDSLPGFLGEEFINQLNRTIEDRLKVHSTPILIIKFWLKEIISLDDDWFSDNMKHLDQSELDLIMDSGNASENTSLLILQNFYDRGLYEKVLTKAKKINEEVFEDYDQKIQQLTDEKIYFDYWKRGIGKITPANYLSRYLDHMECKYDELERWHYSGLITSESLKGILFNNIRENMDVSSRYEFYTVFNSLKFLNDRRIELTNELQGGLIALLQWFFMKFEELDLENLKAKFIYFKPDDQVQIFKRLFYLKHNGKIDFTLNELDQILRADLDLHLANENFNDDFILDISTHVLIEGMKSFVEKGDFVFESDYILKDINKNGNRRFRIQNYFDRCEGRMTAKWNWNTNGQIEELEFVQNGVKKTFFKVNFEYNRNIVEAIKQIPYKGRKYHQDDQYWAVAQQYRDRVLELAKKFRLKVLFLDGKHKSNNAHLVSYTRSIIEKNKLTNRPNIPHGIAYCEGRLSLRKDTYFNNEFWWCLNQECFKNCISNNSEGKKWENYTLLDFLNILNINTDENIKGQLVANGHYSKFLGHINAFNRLLDHLYCRECDQMLYPVSGTNNFSLYRNVHFHCIKENCSKKHKRIYLTRCLYGECPNFIDSRISKKCEHGMYICDECGTCCSVEFFHRKLKYLKKTGGRIHQNLIDKVAGNFGHLERQQYFCYKCESPMDWLEERKLGCKDCGVYYDLSRFKYIHKKWEKTI